MNHEQVPILATILFAQCVLNILVINLWKNALLTKYHGVYQAEQKIHEGFIPRFGGLVIFITLFFCYQFQLFSSEWLNNFYIIFLSLLPLVLVTFLEDVYNNILPIARLFFIFFSSLAVFVYGDFLLPVIDIPYLSEFCINHQWVLIVLLTFSMASMVNAFNLIDGANGLLLFSFISVLSSLYLMADYLNDIDWLNLLRIIITICLIQLFFNFPKARIFAGDLGAYSFGYIVALLVIIFFGQHNEYLTWQAILILFYPAFELIYTFFRRIKSDKSPLEADRLHLHQLIFSYIHNATGKSILSNASTTIILCPICFFPILWIWLHGIQLDLKLISLGLIINLVMYLLYYKVALRLNNHGST